MLTLTRNVAGKFVALDRNKDINNFTDSYREIIPGFIGINISDGSDELQFNFNENEISQSNATDALYDALEGYLPASLNILKKEMREKINEERDGRLYSYFPYAGARWDCNVESRANIIGTVCLALLLGGQVPEGMVWRDYDNVNHPANFNFMAQMGLNMFIYSQQVYAASWQHKYAVDQLLNATQIANYDFANGWPSRSF